MNYIAIATIEGSTEADIIYETHDIEEAEARCRKKAVEMSDEGIEGYEVYLCKKVDCWCED